MRSDTADPSPALQSQQFKIGFRTYLRNIEKEDLKRTATGPMSGNNEAAVAKSLLFLGATLLSHVLFISQPNRRKERAR
jgi:hypothetical protein